MASMRLTLMVLSILRVLPLARTSFTALLIALLLTAASTRSQAVQVHEHKRTVPVDRSPGRSHRKAHAVAPHTTRHSHARTSHPAPDYSTTRYKHSHPAPHVVRTSATTVRRHTHAYRPTRGYATPVGADRVPEVEIATTSVARSTIRGVQSDESLPTEAEPTAQDAANRIAARELPAQRNQIAAAAPPRAYTPIPSSTIIAVAPLRGSLESLVRQNEKTDADDLERIENDADLHDRIVHGVLVPVPASSGLVVNPNLPEDRRYCRPWTATFLRDLAHAHEAQFHHPFEVSSAVRTVEYQKRLMRTNGNAAAAEGDVVSPHLTGATIDIAKQGLNRHELYWMRGRLNALQSEGKIDVEEEFHQSCFHITVYRSYVGEGPPHKPARHLPQPPSGEDDAPSPAEVAAHGR